MSHFTTRLLDFFIAVYVISPLVVLFWRGSWILIGIYSHSLKKFNAWICTSVGFGYVFIHILLQTKVMLCFEGRHHILRRAVWSILLYPLAIAVVAAWRGIWVVLDEYTTTSYISALLTHFIGFLVVFITGTTASIISPPGFMLNNRLLSSVEFSLPVRQLGSARAVDAGFPRALKHVANSFVTVVIIGASVVLYWRGTWTLMDYFHSPTRLSTQLLGGRLSLGLGAVICSVCYWVSEPARVRVLNTVWPSPVKVFVEHVFLYVLGLGVVNFWRGVWYHGNVYILPDNLKLSAWLCHVVSMGLLCIGSASVNLIAPPGGCRPHRKNALEGFNMGSYLELDLRRNVVGDDESCAQGEPRERIKQSDKRVETVTVGANGIAESLNKSIGCFNLAVVEVKEGNENLPGNGLSHGAYLEHISPSTNDRTASEDETCNYSVDESLVGTERAKGLVTGLVTNSQLEEQDRWDTKL